MQVNLTCMDASRRMATRELMRLDREERVTLAPAE